MSHRFDDDRVWPRLRTRPPARSAAFALSLIPGDFWLALVCPSVSHCRHPLEATLHPCAWPMTLVHGACCALLQVGAPHRLPPHAGVGLVRHRVAAAGECAHSNAAAAAPFSYTKSLAADPLSHTQSLAVASATCSQSTGRPMTLQVPSPPALTCTRTQPHPAAAPPALARCPCTWW